jgi:hypothetical protein
MIGEFQPQCTEGATMTKAGIFKLLSVAILLIAIHGFGFSLDKAVTLASFQLGVYSNHNQSGVFSGEWKPLAVEADFFPVWAEQAQFILVLVESKNDESIQFQYEGTLVASNSDYTLKKLAKQDSLNVERYYDDWNNGLDLAYVKTKNDFSEIFVGHQQASELMGIFIDTSTNLSNERLLDRLRIEFQQANYSYDDTPNYGYVRGLTATGTGLNQPPIEIRFLSPRLNEFDSQLKTIRNGKSQTWTGLDAFGRWERKLPDGSLEFLDQYGTSPSIIRLVSKEFPTGIWFEWNEKANCYQSFSGKSDYLFSTFDFHNPVTVTLPNGKPVIFAPKR